MAYLITSKEDYVLKYFNINEIKELKRGQGFLFIEHESGFIANIRNASGYLLKDGWRLCMVFLWSGLNKTI